MRFLFDIKYDKNLWLLCVDQEEIKLTRITANIITNKVAKNILERKVEKTL